MTFRRRLLVATLTVGVGIWSFQPVMRMRMEARLSEILGGQVDIGTSRISLRDGTITFGDVLVRPNSQQTSNGLESEPLSGPVRIGQAALKFHWNAALYRNLNVESFLASNVDWKIVAPSTRHIPIARETADLHFVNQSEQSPSWTPRIDSVIQPIKLRLTEESTKQSRTQQKISMQLKSIAERLDDLQPDEGSLNLLRHRFVVDDAKKEIALIKQWIAEDRLGRKEADKAVSSLKLSAQKQLAANFNAPAELNTERAMGAAKEVAGFAIAKEWNQCRPFVHAAIKSLTSLRAPIASDLDKPIPERTHSNESKLNGIESLPVGMTNCAAGKIEGKMEFTPELATALNSDFVLQFWNLTSRSFLREPSSTVALKLKRQAEQDTAPWLVCTAQQLSLNHSEAIQIQVNLEKKDERLGMSNTKILHANQGWAATVTLPIQFCYEMPCLTSIANAKPNDKGVIVAKLIGTTSLGEPEPNDLLIDIEPASLKVLASALSDWHIERTEKQRVQAGVQGTELLNNELLVMNSLWDQLGDEHARAHENWESRIAELSEQVQQLSTAFQRTSRVPSAPIQ